MKGSTLLRLGFAAGIAVMSSGVVASPLLYLPYASQIITYHYDASGRLIAVVHSGTGAPSGCTNSAPTWGTGTLGCFRWGS